MRYSSGIQLDKARYVRVRIQQLWIQCQTDSGIQRDTDTVDQWRSALRKDIEIDI